MYSLTSTELPGRQPPSHHLLDSQRLPSAHWSFRGGCGMSPKSSRRCGSSANLHWISAASSNESRISLAIYLQWFCASPSTFNSHDICIGTVPKASILGVGGRDPPGFEVGVVEWVGGSWRVWFQVFYAVKGGTGTQDPQFSNQIDATERRNSKSSKFVLCHVTRCHTVNRQTAMYQACT
jgi:hypothetical protein